MVRRKYPLSTSSFKTLGDKFLFSVLLCAACYGVFNIAPGLRLFTAMGRIFVDHNFDMKMAIVPACFGFLLMFTMAAIKKMEDKL